MRVLVSAAMLVAVLSIIDRGSVVGQRLHRANTAPIVPRGPRGAST
jgi:hypothetical protein